MRRISVPFYALALAGGVALGVVFTLGVVFWASEGARDEAPTTVLVAKHLIPAGTQRARRFARAAHPPPPPCGSSPGTQATPTKS